MKRRVLRRSGQGEAVDPQRASDLDATLGRTLRACHHLVVALDPFVAKSLRDVRRVRLVRVFLVDHIVRAPTAGMRVDQHVPLWSEDVGPKPLRGMADPHGRARLRDSAPGVGTELRVLRLKSRSHHRCLDHAERCKRAVRHRERHHLSPGDIARHSFPGRLGQRSGQRLLVKADVSVCAYGAPRHSRGGACRSRYVAPERARLRLGEGGNSQRPQRQDPQRGRATDPRTAKTRHTGDDTRQNG